MKQFLFFVIVALAGHVLADGPIIQTTPYTQSFLRAQNSAAAQAALNLAGVTSLTVVSNTAIAALAPTNQIVSQALQYAQVNSTNSVQARYDIRQFGAVCDGMVADNCSVTAGSATLTTSQAQWQSSDVGKTICIWMAGAKQLNGTNQCLTTTIAGYVSPEQITLAGDAISTVSGMPAIYGHDDSAAWQEAINYVAPRGGTIFVPLLHTNTYSISLIADAVQDVGTWTAHYNAQVYAPYISSTWDVPVMTIEGATQPSLNEFGQLPLWDWQPHGCYIVSTLAGGAAGDNKQWMFNFSGQGGFSLNFLGYMPNFQYTRNQLMPAFKDIHLIKPYDSGAGLVNAAGCISFQCQHCTFASGLYDWLSMVYLPVPNLTNDTGLNMPQNYAGNKSIVQDCDFITLNTAAFWGENSIMRDGNIQGAQTAINFQNSGGQPMVFDGNVDFQNVGTCFDDFGSQGTLDVNTLSVQNIGTNSTFPVDYNAGFTNWILLNDPHDVVFGHANIVSSGGFGAICGTNQAVVNGGLFWQKNLSSVEGLPQSDIPPLSGDLYFNGSTGFPGVGLKDVNFFASPYSENVTAQSRNFAFLQYDAAVANGNSLNLGYSGDSVFGCQTINFGVSPTETTAAAPVGSINRFGDWTLSQAGAATTINGTAEVKQGLTLDAGITENETAGDYRQVNATGANLTSVYWSSFSGTRSPYWRIGLSGIPVSFQNAPVNGYDWTWESLVDNNKFAAVTTNAEVLATGGFGSTATNSVPFYSTGITNTLTVDLQVYDLSGGAYWVTNLTTGFCAKYSPGGNWNQTIVLQPGDAIVWISGATLQSAGNRAL